MTEENPTRAAVDFASQLLAEVREELSRADGKASILFAAATVVAAAIITGIVAGPWSPTDLRPFAQTLWWLGTLFVAAGLGFLGSAVYPRVRDPHESNRVTYFMHVLVHLEPNDLRRVLEVEARDPLSRSIHQLQALSPIVKRKYRDVAHSLKLLTGGVVLTVLAALIG